MDIYSFINSGDIRQYLKEINYTFTVPETAFLIYQSRTATLKEKFSVWQEIIDSMPDCSMKQRFNMESIESFHQFLRDYMALLNKMTDLFFISENAVYTYEIFEKSLCSVDSSDYDWCEAGLFFADYDCALSHFKKYYQEETFGKIRFVKCFIQESDEEQHDKNIKLELNSDLEITSIDFPWTILEDSESDTMLAFEGMWFPFPTPFKRGDILIDRRRSGRPFVLNSISTWSSEDYIRNGYTAQDDRVKQADRLLARNLKYADTTDMNYDGYFIQGDAACGFQIVFDVNQSYLELERYTENLTGEQRVLKVISGMISPDRKGKVDIDFFGNTCHLIFMEELYRREKKLLESIYIEEELKKFGLIDD